ncbi:MAG: pyridoxamine 5'-phosphate oxidase family protein [Pseudomonadota bacterium]
MTDPDLNLDNVLSDIWLTLGRARADARHAWRYPVFGTIDSDGWPMSRTVGLREVDATSRKLAIHTDVRAAKVQEVIDHSKCSLLFYNPRTMEQLRVTGLAGLRGEAETADAWSKLSVHQHHNYSVDPAPGSEIAAWNDYGHAATAETIAARFRVIDVSVVSFDWIRLDRPVNGIGHKRAAFNLEAKTGNWLVP